MPFIRVYEGCYQDSSSADGSLNSTVPKMLFTIAKTALPKAITKKVASIRQNTFGSANSQIARIQIMTLATTQSDMV